MSELLKMIHEQFLDYDKELKELEKEIINTLKTIKSNGIIITGIIYDNKNKIYLKKSRIKVPLYFYKILVLNKKNVLCWIGSNYDGAINKTNLKEINNLLIKYSNKISIKL
jgi:DNA/RNA endonuclease G (NUC1)